MVILLNGISNTLSTSIDLENFTIAAIPPFSVLKTIRRTWRSWTAGSKTVGSSTAKPPIIIRVVNPNKIACSHNPWTTGSIDPKLCTLTFILISSSYVQTWACRCATRLILLSFDPTGQPFVTYVHVLQTNCASMVYCY